MKKYLFLFLFLFVPSLLGAAEIQLKPMDKELDLSPLVEYYWDDSQNLTVEEVAQKDKEFQRWGKKNLNLGYSEKALWIRFTLHNPSTFSQTRLLELRNSVVDLVELYRPAVFGGFGYDAGGDSLDFNEREYNHFRFIFSLSLPPEGKKTYYMRVVSLESLSLPLKLWDEKHYFEQILPEVFLVAVFCGIILMMFLYHVVLFVATGDKAYFHYSFFIIGLLLYSLTMQGVAYQYLWPHFPAFNQVSVAFWVCWSLFFASLFARSYLHSSLYCPAQDKLLTFFLVVSPLSLFLLWVTGMQIFMMAAPVLAILFAPTLLLLGWISMLRGYRPAIFYLIAFGGSMLAVVITVLKAFGTVPENFFTNNVMIFGTIWQIMILATALAFRFRSYREEKEIAQEELLQSITREKKTIQDHSLLLEGQVKARTQDIKDLLDNVGQGFFSFSDNYKIHSAYSKACKTFFQSTDGGEIQDCDALAVLFGEEGESHRPFFDSIFLKIGDFSALLSLLPAETKLGDQIYQLDYRFILADEEGEKDKVMVIVTDITQARELEALLEKDERINQMILAVARDKEGFLEAMNDIRKMFKELFRELEKEEDAISISQLFRTYHTIKGILAGYCFDDATIKTHEIETLIEPYRKSGESLIAASVLSIRENTLDLEELFLSSFEKLAGVISQDDLDEAKGHRRFSVPQGKIQRLVDLLNANPIDYELVKNSVSDLNLEPVGKILSKFASQSKILASQLGKELRVEIKGSNIEVNFQNLKPFFATLVHLIRNAVDHGLEESSERELFEKPSEGLLKLEAVKDDSGITLICSDDGRGIDKELVIAKAIDKKMLTEEEAQKLTDQEVYNLILQPGFSTKEEATSLSGRGVGLDAIKTELDKLGGVIKINTELGQGTKFTLLIPQA